MFKYLTSLWLKLWPQEEPELKPSMWDTVEDLKDAPNVTLLTPATRRRLKNKRDSKRTKGTKNGR